MNVTKLSKVAALAVFFSTGLSAANAPLVFKSGPGRVCLIELYTSEGCSSCPPAEKWLGALKDSAQLWAAVVPVAFHVDYWDGQGWPDILASDKYTARQYQYAQKWGTRSVYTPGFVLNGKEWRGWYSHGQPEFESPDSPGELKIEMMNENQFRVHFFPKTNASTWQANVALMGFGIASPVTKGENKGKTLEHNFSVMGFKQVPMSKDNGGYSGIVMVTKTSPVTPKRWGVAAWVTADGITPVQAAGGYLN